MAEVISLLTSSPHPSPPEEANVRQPQTIAKRSASTRQKHSDIDLQPFDVSDISFPDIDDFPSEQASKRRKLSPPRSRSRISHKGPSLLLAEGCSNPFESNIVFDLSSECGSSFSNTANVTNKQSVATNLKPNIYPSATDLNVETRSIDLVVDIDVDDNGSFPFSSSAPELSRPLPQLQADTNVFDSHMDYTATLPDDLILISSSQPSETVKQPVISSRTASLLANLNARASHSSTFDHGRGSASHSTAATLFARSGRKVVHREGPGIEILDEITDSSQSGVGVNLSQQDMLPAPPPLRQEDQVKWKSKSTITTTRQSKSKNTNPAESKAADRAQQKADRQKEKERLQEEKRRTAEITEANKQKTNKKASTSEMIVDMSEAFENTALGSHIDDLLKALDVQTTYFSEPAGISQDLTSDNFDTEIEGGSPSESMMKRIVKWRRKTSAEYNPDEDIWTPLSHTKITPEKHVLIYLTAEEFCTLAVRGTSVPTSTSLSADETEKQMKTNLDRHISHFRTRYPQSTLVILIQGLTSWFKRKLNVQNRAYTAAVRAQAAASTSTFVSTSTSASANKPRRKRRTANPSVSASATDSQPDLSSIDQNIGENLLLHLQISHPPLLIHHTTSVSTSAQQISSFTQHLSTRPYRQAQQLHNLKSASFCMDTGQVKTGTTAREVLVLMLQEVNRVTPSMAHGVVAGTETAESGGLGYSSVSELVDAFSKHGNLLLEDVKKAINTDGAWSDRRLGPMVSKRLYKVFMGTDPAARDGIA